MTMLVDTPWPHFGHGYRHLQRVTERQPACSDVNEKPLTWWVDVTQN
jgi:hypothetical protein